MWSIIAGHNSTVQPHNIGLGLAGLGDSKTYTWYEMIRAGHPGYPDTGLRSQEGMIDSWSDAR